jgi:hypothetical protein
VAGKSSTGAVQVNSRCFSDYGFQPRFGAAMAPVPTEGSKSQT